MISYEVSIGLIIIGVIISGSMNFGDNVRLKTGHMASLAGIGCRICRWCSCSLSRHWRKHNRPPFDLPEAESELVAGYQVEYSSPIPIVYGGGIHCDFPNVCAYPCCSLAVGYPRSWYS